MSNMKQYFTTVVLEELMWYFTLDTDYGANSEDLCRHDRLAYSDQTYGYFVYDDNNGDDHLYGDFDDWEDYYDSVYN